MTQTVLDSRLVNHLIDQRYIKDKSVAETFMSCISEEFKSQLQDDVSYEMTDV